MTPLKAIRAKRLSCSCGSPSEVRLCPIPDCALWPFRSGHNPARQGVRSECPSESETPLPLNDFNAAGSSPRVSSSAERRGYI